MMLRVPFASWHEKTPLWRRVEQVKLKKSRGMDFCRELMENCSPNSKVEGVKGIWPHPGHLPATQPEYMTHQPCGKNHRDPF